MSHPHVSRITVDIADTSAHSPSAVTIATKITTRPLIDNKGGDANILRDAEHLMYL